MTPEEKMAKQTVEVGSIWDMRDEEDPRTGSRVGLFRVKRIDDGIAYDSENPYDEDALSMPVEILADSYVKLTPEQAGKVERDIKEYHRSTIQPIKAPNGKIIQVGSTWEIKRPNSTNESENITVASLSAPNVVWYGQEHSGFGRDASNIFEYGTEIPLNELQSYWSKRRAKTLEKEIIRNLESDKDVAVERVFYNGRLLEFKVTVTGKKKGKSPTVSFHDRQATPEEKEEDDKAYKSFLEWVANERALAAGNPMGLLTRMPAYGMPVKQIQAQEQPQTTINAQPEAQQKEVPAKKEIIEPKQKRLKA